MLGWHVSVYRKTRGGRRPAKFGSRAGALLAQWQGGLGALSWLDELVRTGQATDLGGNGYPVRYTLRCELARPVVLAGPPEAREQWVFDAGDVIDSSLWRGRTHVDVEAFASVSASEWLIVEAWDES